MKKVFLGGTCNGSEWRDVIIPELKIDFFNPIVEDWTIGNQIKELNERKTCDYLLYVLTPKMNGIYSIAEVVDDSNKHPEKTILCILDVDYDEDEEEIEWTNGLFRSLKDLESLVESNGAKVFDNLEDVVEYLNNNS
jgi:hypothetical protein